MNSILRSGIVASALAALLTTVITRYQSIINDAILSWILIGAGAALTSLAISWGATQAFKFLFVDVDLSTPPSNGTLTSLDDIQAARERWLAAVRRAKRGIYVCAMICCLVPSLSLGVILLLLNITSEARVVYSIVWATGSIMVSFGSPWLWKIVFQVLVPWMLAKEKVAT